MLKKMLWVFLQNKIRQKIHGLKIFPSELGQGLLILTVIFYFELLNNNLSVCWFALLPLNFEQITLFYTSSI